MISYDAFFTSMKYCTLIFISYLSLTACYHKHNEKQIQADIPKEIKHTAVIFGEYKGESNAPWTICIKVDSSGAYVDTTDSYLQNNVKDFNFHQYPLDSICTLIAQNFVKNIPITLIDSAKSQIDCTQCYDLGGQFLQIITPEYEVFYHTNCAAEKCNDTLKTILQQLDSTLYQIVKNGNLKWP